VADSPPPPNEPYEFVIKLDVKADGVPLPTVNANLKSSAIFKETIDVAPDPSKKPVKVTVKFPTLDADPKFVLLATGAGPVSGNLFYSFTDPGDVTAAGVKGTPLQGTQLFFWGSQSLLAATGKTVLFFWTDKPVTVQIIVGYDAKPAS
jgi:hypothetical protein